MAKMTKAAARKRLNEAVIKMTKVQDYLNINGMLTSADYRKFEKFYIDAHHFRKKLGGGN